MTPAISNAKEDFLLDDDVLAGDLRGVVEAPRLLPAPPPLSSHNNRIS